MVIQHHYIINIHFSPCDIRRGIKMIKKVGKPHNEREENELYKFEKTSELVDTGIFKYIRHPLYASLLYLAWGLFFKSPSLLDGCLVLVTTAFLYATARADEAECVQKFGQEYVTYLKKTRMFIPLVF